MPNWIPLAQFAQRTPQGIAQADWQHPVSRPTSAMTLRAGVEEVVDTVTALQRAEWLEDGVYVGTNAFAETYETLVECARCLGVAVPPAVISPIPARKQRILGTDARPFLHLSSFFLRTAPVAERQFALGRLLGPIATRRVTSDSLYALLVDDGGLRTLARRSLGPTVEVALAPASLAARLLWSRSHRMSEISADRAGLLCTYSITNAGRALLRMALGVTPDVEPDAYLAQLNAHRDGSPGKWAELLASSPWTHKRIGALKLFSTSQAYARAQQREPDASSLSDVDLDAAVDALLEIRPWSA